MHMIMCHSISHLPICFQALGLLLMLRTCEHLSRMLKSALHHIPAPCRCSAWRLKRLLLWRIACWEFLQPAAVGPQLSLGITLHSPSLMCGALWFCSGWTLSPSRRCPIAYKHTLSYALCLTPMLCNLFALVVLILQSVCIWIPYCLLHSFHKNDTCTCQ